MSRRIASLQLLCRLQIQSSISSEALLPKLPLPSRIKTLIGNLFAQTIRCCVPDIKSLREFVSRPPACSARLYCTMIRHDDESNISSGTCYTLYLEYLGGLVPLLKGKRTSKIRPEFVIFDPQVDDLSILSQCSSDSVGTKSSSASSQSTSATTGRSESSESDLDDGCRGSPRLQRKKKSRKKKNIPVPTEKIATENANDIADELAYVDTLPEEVKLVEVTSNIWGTKFKIHGLAKTVPSNLGQVTYKTSLLHLQPRQMTLVITELRDDFSTDPDPNFNPNLFSEDEEDQSVHHQHNPVPGPQRRPPEGSPPIAPMSPRPNRFTSRLKTPVPPPALTAVCSTSNSASLARAESYDDELPYVDFSDLMIEQIVSKPKEATSSPRPGPSYCSLVTQYSRSSTSSSNQSRHAISPLYCEGSVPTLQSPKNAVAPSDIIFDRPPAGQTTLLSYTSNSDYSNHVVQVKNAIINSEPCRVNSHVNPVPFNLNLNLERMESTKACKDKTNSSKRKDLQYIDETPTTSIGPVIENQMRRAPTVASITPSYLPDSITRSCSVGYLDSVEMVPSDVALSMLRRDAPNKRLVLVDKKPQRRNKKYSDEHKKTKLRQSGKSKSLDSCDLLQESNETNNCNDGTKQMPKLNEASETDSDCMSPVHQRYNNNVVDAETSSKLASKTNVETNVNRQEKICPICQKSSIVGSPAQTICVFCRRNQLYKKLDVNIGTSKPPIQKDPFRNLKESKILVATIENSMGEPSSTRDMNRVTNDKKPPPATSAPVKKKTEVITSYTDSPLFSRKYRYNDSSAKFSSETRTPILGRKSDIFGDSIKKRIERNASQAEDDNVIEVTPIEPSRSVSLHTQVCI